LKPKKADYFVLKPLHSGFFSTVLHLLLEHFDSETLILTGFAANLCVMSTANDAHMLGYRLLVPIDCTAASSRERAESTLAYLRDSLAAETPTAAEVDFAELAARPAKLRRRPFSR
jgi:nicotinamidase-related amidase